MMTFAMAHPILSFLGFIVIWSLTCELISNIIVNMCKTIMSFNTKERNDG